MLSFADEDEEGEDSDIIQTSKFGKDPTVETSFLPDKDREMRKQKLREDLEREWKEKQVQVRSLSLSLSPCHNALIFSFI